MAEVDFTPDPSQQRTKESPLGFLSGFLYKAFFTVVVLFLLPLFPSQAPEFVNHTILTRSWELIHLLFVGIAVSYGLFSRRNADPTAVEKDLLQKLDTSQSYVSEVLQVASVFDDEEVEKASVVDGSKVHMWNSRYYRGESTLVVEQENSGDRSEMSKPLLLPVRSLKTNVPDPEPVDEGQILHVSTVPRLRSGDLGQSEEVVAAEVEEEGVVHPSPIPWRSRSGRIDVNTASDMSSARSFAVVRSRSFQSWRTRRASPSPLTSPSRETSVKNIIEDSATKRSFHKPSAPPPAPPLPPPYSTVHKSQYNPQVYGQTRRVFKDEPKDVSQGGGGRDPTSLPATKTMSFSGGRIPLENTRPPVAAVPKSTQPDKKNKNVSSRKFIIDSSSDSDSDSDRAPNSSTDGAGDDDEEEASESGVEEEADVNEVDKKADEFIAKFREQIRLQRIESIKRSTVQKRGTAIVED